MAEFPNFEEMAKNVAEQALDNFLYDGKSIREWMQIIASEDAISRQAVLDVIEREEFKGDAISEVEKLPPVQPQAKTGWIPVSERLPNIHNYMQEYIVTIKGNFIRTAFFTETNGKSWWNIDNVIAWMPLPEPYKAESEDKE